MTQRNLSLWVSEMVKRTFVIQLLK